MSFGFLNKERIVAGPGFNRWLVPPAALAIHLCIGMPYGFSVFWLPLSKALGVGYKWFMSDAELVEERRYAHERSTALEKPVVAKGLGGQPDCIGRAGMGRRRGSTGLGCLQDAHQRRPILHLRGAP